MDSQEAFDLLLKQVDAAIEESLARGAAATKKGDRDAMEAEAERQRNLVDTRDQILNLKSLWAKLVGRRPPSATSQPPSPPLAGLMKPQSPSSPAGRAPRPRSGRKTPEQAYWKPILIALKEVGGRGEVYAILNRVGQLISDTLTEFDRQDLPSGADVRWRNTAQWARLKMKKQGLLADNSPLGVWEITDKGRRYLADHSS